VITAGSGKHRFSGLAPAALHPPRWRVSPRNLQARRSTSSEPVGRLGHVMKCARSRLAVNRTPQRQPHSIRRSRLPFPLNLEELPSSVTVLGVSRPLRAYGEVRANLAPGKIAAGAPSTLLVGGPMSAIIALVWSCRETTRYAL
jgi:hypothetical protein